MKSRSIGGEAAAGCADAAADVAAEVELVAAKDVGADADGTAAAVGGMGATEGVGREGLAGEPVGALGGATGTDSSCG